MALTAAQLHNERALVGSFISTEDRPGGLRSMVEVQVQATDFEDELARMVMQGIERASDESLDPNAEVILAIVLRDGLFHRPAPTDEDGLASYQSLVKSFIVSMELMGYNDPGAVSSIASAVRDAVNTRRLQEYGNKVMRISSDMSMTAQDRYAQLAAELEIVRPNNIEARVYTLDDQIAIMEQTKDARAAMVGQRLMTCPPEWWLQEYIPFLIPGLMYVVTAYTSYGKSSVMLQWAYHLASCGKKVIYFHAEDDIVRQLDRVTRRMTHATARELASGDPRDKYEIVGRRLRGIKDNVGGEVIFCHCIGQPVSFIQSVCDNYRPDAIFVDYVQKLNNAPQMALVGGKTDAALALVAERVKQIAENDKSMCVAVLGSQEVEHEKGSEFRKGTMGSRQIEHKAQVIIEVERTRLTEADGPEDVGGVRVASPGELSAFSRMVIHKNSDGPTGSSTGLMFGTRFEYISIEYLKWQEAHPNAAFPTPVLRVPDEEYYRNQAQRDRAMESLHREMPDIRTRRANAKRAKAGGGDMPF